MSFIVPPTERPTTSSVVPLEPQDQVPTCGSNVTNRSPIPAQTSIPPAQYQVQQGPPPPVKHSHYYDFKVYLGFQVENIIFACEQRFMDVHVTHIPYMNTMRVEGSQIPLVDGRAQDVENLMWYIRYGDQRARIPQASEHPSPNNINTWVSILDTRSYGWVLKNSVVEDAKDAIKRLSATSDPVCRLSFAQRLQLPMGNDWTKSAIDELINRDQKPSTEECKSLDKDVIVDIFSGRENKQRESLRKSQSNKRIRAADDG